MRKNVFSSVYKKNNEGTNKSKYLECKSRKSPLYIDVELTNHCNLQCYMCPVGTFAMKRQRGYMTMETVDKICAELMDSSIEGVRLIRWGEPTLHPQFIEILRKFKNTNKLIHFNTNGTLLDRAMIEKIVEMDIDSVKFSFQGCDEKSYLEMRSGSSWDKVMENICLFNEIRGNKEKPFIQISTTLTDETEEKKDNFINAIENKCDYYNIGKTQLCHLNIDKMIISEERKQKFKDLQSRESLSCRHFSVCEEVFDKLSINWDGSVSACCIDYDDMLIVGNINENSLSEIFCNSKMNEIREIIRDSDYDKIGLCRTCYDYINIEGNEKEE